jgi:hypothetical protein
VVLCCAAAAGRKADVDKVFREASSMGMTAARTWAHSISQKFPFQIAAGKRSATQQHQLLDRTRQVQQAWT